MKLAALVAVPLGVVTDIGPVSAPVGTIVMILPGASLTITAAWPLNRTLVAPARFAPTIWMRSPAAAVPGEKDDTAGNFTCVSLNTLPAGSGELSCNTSLTWVVP